MKSFISLFRALVLVIFLAMGNILYAQNGFNYQAVIRDGGQISANENVTVEFIITTSGGTIVYAETHSTTTNDYGLVNLVIGSETPTTGAFLNINWGAHDYFLEVKIDGLSMGTTQLLGVPYAKVATAMRLENLINVNPGSPSNGDALTWNGSEWVAGGSSSIWSQNGNTAYYENPVAIGAQSSNEQFYVVNSTGGRIAKIEHTNANSGNDVLELQVQSGATDEAAFIEMERGAVVEARINTDGSAEFSNVTVRENLDNLNPPETGRLYANSLPVAYGYVSSGTTTASLVTDFGVASITKPASTTGVYQITLNKSIVGQPVIIATGFSSSPNDEILTANRISANEIEINIADGTGAGTNSNFYFVVFGEVQ